LPDLCGADDRKAAICALRRVALPTGHLAQKSMVTLLLIRHATCDPVGRLLAGRAPGVRLNEEGRAQAARLAERLRGVELDAVYSSPMERALETAVPFARQARREVETMGELNEIEFGEWTGCTFDQLASSDEWRRFNELRSTGRPPGGESMVEVQARALRAVEAIRSRHPAGTCAVVSHGDVLRSLIAYLAGIPIDLFQRLEVSPASISIVRIGERDHTILRVNDVSGTV
jgi:probable phosphoglycerate mutase